MIGVKVNRSDFLKDKNKPFRSDPSKGMGEYKLYLCPSGLINTDEVPDSWGLLWADDNNKVSIEKPAIKSTCNLLAERAVLLSLHRRNINK